jgi:hypothetical protein
VDLPFGVVTDDHETDAAGPRELPITHRMSAKTDLSMALIGVGDVPSASTNSSSVAPTGTPPNPRRVSSSCRVGGWGGGLGRTAAVECGEASGEGVAAGVGVSPAVAAGAVVAVGGWAVDGARAGVEVQPARVAAANAMVIMVVVLGCMVTSLVVSGAVGGLCGFTGRRAIGPVCCGATAN